MTAQCNLSIKQAQFQPVERNSEEKIQQRYEWVQKWQQTDLDFATNCVFLDESAFHINLKRGAISATGLINVSLRVPKRIKKRKLGHEADTYSTGTVTGHYLSFLKATLDEMDRYPEMKGHYLVMDNAPIHSSTDIEEIKVLVITYHLEKLVSAAKAGREYNVDERTAQRWIKEYKRQQQHGEPDEAKKKPGPKKTLGEEHKAHLMQYIDDNPSTVLNQAMESLTQQFEGLKIKKTAVYDFVTKECNISFKKLTSMHWQEIANSTSANDTNG
ncbi:hypothetical protein DFQ30_007644 [Apophysomyces sp. BC1015]|nr:hypothetical protein DFQ30_007644 [Apophysomyces sp. BC1015]